MEKHTTYFYRPVNNLFLWGLQIYDIENKYFNILYKCYSFAMLGVLGFGYLATEITYSLDHVYDLRQFTFSLGYVMAHTISVIKLILFVFKRKAIGRFVSSLEQGEFLPSFERGGNAEKKLIDDAIWRTKMQGRAFISTVGLLVGSNFVQVVIYTKQMIAEQRANVTISQPPYPYPSKLPFRLSSNPAASYFLESFYQSACVWIFGLYLGYSDMIIGGLMMHVTAQFRIVTNALLTVMDKAERKTNIQLANIWEDNSVMEVYGERYIDPIINQKLNDNLLICVNDCVKHHNDILDLLENMENTFNDLVLIQILGYLIAICVALYQMSLTKIPSASFMSTLSFTMAMTFQCLIYCWNGNEVSLYSVKVADAAFDCRWITSSTAVKLSLVMIIQRAQRLSYLTAGKFVRLTLETFMSICRGAMSFSLVLRTVNEDEIA